MASGHVNRTQRPNTWLHRPSLRREDSPCQLGAVHTWPIATDRILVADRRFRGITDMAGAAAGRPQTRMTHFGHSRVAGTRARDLC
jgi:hypothetical protein